MGVSFSVGGWGASLLNGGQPPWEGISFDGEVFVKNIWDGGGALVPPMGKLASGINSAAISFM